MSDKRECILCDQELPNTQTYDDSIVKKVAVDLFDNCKLRNKNTTLKATCDKYEEALKKCDWYLDEQLVGDEGTSMMDAIETRRLVKDALANEQENE